MPVAKGATLDPAQTRAGILRAATDLLYQRGLDGIGVAELCATIGVSKETLYRHFGSKEGLIQAVLEARSDRILRWARDAVAAAGDDPVDQLGAAFDALTRWHEKPTFRGCAILNAATQQHDGPARSLAKQHLNRQLDILTDITRRAGAGDAVSLAQQLLALRVGATVLADHHSATDAARLAKQAALTLLRSALAPPGRRRTADLAPAGSRDPGTSGGDDPDL
jgi:AcrR family transcriptional regulator